jgi:hypothetical protein
VLVCVGSNSIGDFGGGIHGKARHFSRSPTSTLSVSFPLHAALQHCTVRWWWLINS